MRDHEVAWGGKCFEADRETLIKLAERDTRLRDVKALAVTMEPVGGSPTRQPTGSPVCSGAVAPMRRT